MATGTGRDALCAANSTLRSARVETPAASLEQTSHSSKLQSEECHRIDFRRAGERRRRGAPCIIQTAPTATEQAALRRSASAVHTPVNLMSLSFS